MSTLLISTSLDLDGKGNQIARSRLEWIEHKNHLLPDFDNETIFQSESFGLLHGKIQTSSGMIVVAPIYNWSTDPVQDATGNP